MVFVLCVLLVVPTLLPFDFTRPLLTTRCHKTIASELSSVEGKYLDHRETIMQLVKNQKANADNSYVLEALLTAMAVFTVVTLTPTMALCSAMRQVWPLVLMAAVVIAGTIFGLLLHKQFENDAVVQIPFSHVPNMPRNGAGHNFKKAA